MTVSIIHDNASVTLFSNKIEKQCAIGARVLLIPNVSVRVTVMRVAQSVPRDPRESLFIHG